LEYSPAGIKNGKAVDGTAVQLYPSHPAQILQDKANITSAAMQRQRTYIQPAKREPRTYQEKLDHERLRQSSYDKAGLDRNGQLKPGTRLMESKTWNRLNDNIVEPMMLMATVAEGGNAAGGLLNSTRNFITKKEFEGLSMSGVLDPNRIRFSQNSIAEEFKDGGKIEDLIHALKEGQKVDVPPIRIVEFEGQIYTLDNRRLYSYQQANLEIPYLKLDVIPAKEKALKFTTQNQGVKIDIRKKP